MKHVNAIRLGAMLLAIVMVISLLPVSAFAADNLADTSAELTKGAAINGTNYFVTSVKNYTIAPDISEKIIITNNESGTAQTVANVMEVDISGGQAKLAAGYGNLNPTTQGWTMKTTTDQAHLYEEAYNENVVGGLNAAIFNIANGEPMGHLVMRGVTYQENTNFAFLAVFDDGSVGLFSSGVTLAEAAQMQTEKQGTAVQVEEAVSGWMVLVDGETVATTGSNPGNYSRSAVGMKEDGTIVLMQSDGGVAPRSTGYTIEEMGRMMQALGCVYAIELDEGGSSTYVSQRASEDDVSMKNSAAGGTERVISTSILVVSLYEGEVVPGEDENHEHTYTYALDTDILTCTECGYICAAADEYYSGWATESVTGRAMYFTGGNYATGDLKMEDNSVCYFDENGMALQDEVVICGENCIFDQGQYVSSENSNVKIAGTSGTGVQWLMYNDGTFKVDGEGAMRDYGIRGATPWADIRAQITSIEIGAGVTSIGVYAFYGATKCTSVSFEVGSKLNSINGSSFYYMNKLKSIILPDGVKSIGNYAFGYCTSLEDVFMPTGISSINSTAFNYCSSDKLVLDVAENSYAHQYAESAGISYTLRETTHDWDAGTVVAAPTCTKSGVKLYTCPDCRETKTEEIEAAGHSFDSGVVTSAATCIANGVKTYTCRVCGYGETESIPVNPDNHDYDEGVVITEPTTETTGEKKYTCQDCGNVYVAQLPALAAENPFTDVKENDYFYDPVMWAVGNEITNGMTDSTFVPKGTITREQFVTFLWRMAGEPEPETTENPFTDVKNDQWHAYSYKAILWAYENEITTGATATTFNPNGACTRAQVVAFLWRYAEKPEVTGVTNKFTDVKETQWTEYYYDAVLWAVQNRITTGVTDTTFCPNDTCTRAQCVTFLYRYDTGNS